MRTYIVFDKKTGDPIQTIVDMSDLPADPTKLLESVDPKVDRNTLDVALVPEIRPGSHYRVDPKSKNLEPADPKQARGSGAGSARAYGVPTVTPLIETVHHKDRSRQ